MCGEDHRGIGQRDDLHAAAGGPAHRQQPHAVLGDDEVFDQLQTVDLVRA